MDVLDDHDVGPACAELAQQSSGDVGRSGVVGEQLPELAAGVLGDVHQRAQRARREQRVAGAPEHARRRALLGCERAHERRLSDTRLAADEQHPARVARAGGVQGAAQDPERICALEQRRC